jgi:hypothetical protein
MGKMPAAMLKKMKGEEKAEGKKEPKESKGKAAAEAKAGMFSKGGKVKAKC